MCSRSPQGSGFRLAAVRSGRRPKSQSGSCPSPSGASRDAADDVDDADEAS